MTLLVDTNVDWVPTDDTFGARLALVRQRFGWNMKEAAIACGVPQNSWVEWETKGRTPRNLPAVAQQIHKTTGVNDYWLMTGKRTESLPSAPVMCTPRDLNPEPTGYGSAPSVTTAPRGRAKKNTGPRNRGR